MNIQWYPGHMTKTRRMIAEQLKNVDAVCEILDARIPISSRNPDVDELTAGKPRLVVLNRVDQADPAATRRWADWFRAKGYAVLESNAKAGAGTKQFAAAVREKTGRPVVMVLPTEEPETIPHSAEDRTATFAGPPAEEPATEFARLMK